MPSLVVRAVVAREDDERPLLELERLERAHELTELGVEVRDHLVRVRVRVRVRLTLTLTLTLT